MPTSTDGSAGASRVSDAVLTPLAFLDRSADVWRDRIAVRAGDRTWTHAEHAERIRRAASALRSELAVAPGDRVAMLLPNVAAMLELHYAVPGAGAVWCRSTRGSPRTTTRTSSRTRARRVVFAGSDVAAAARRTRSPSSGRGARPRSSGSTRGVVALRVRGAARRRGSPRRSHRPAGRARAALDQLHVRDDRAPEGRHDLAPRRLPAQPRRDRRGGPDAARARTCGRCRCSTATAGRTPGR